MSRAYAWIITESHLESLKDELGTLGPGGAVYSEEEITEFGRKFEMYDDDDILYYTGYICGEYDGFEPLDDFGMPNAGCTSIKLDSGHGDMLTL
jgi:hypothetical protein